MKKNIIIIVALLCSCGVAAAQSTLKTAYFMDRMTTRHDINPALMNESGFLAIPALGDFSIGLNSGLSIDDFIYPLDNGDFGLFLHPDVDSSDFIGGLKENNVTAQELKLTLFGMGFYGFGGYNTFNISVRENLSLNIKKSFFEFLAGSNSSTGAYDMSGTSLELMTWAEVGFGHSHRINDNLTVGVKLKYLAGAANVNLTLDQMQFEASEEQLMANIHATGNAAAMGMQFEGAFTDLAFDTFDYASASNGGFAVDFGATYEWEKLTIGVAMTDLGKINWSAPSSVELGASTSFTGFEDLDVTDVDNLQGNIEDQLNDLTDSFMDLSDDITLAAIDPYSTSLSAKLIVSAEYEVNSLLSAGVLSTTTFGTINSNEIMGVVTLRPSKWFNIAVSGTTSSLYGTYWGWAINYCPHYFINFFIGSDSMVTNVNSQYIPYDSTNLNLKMGLSIPLGKLHKVN